MSHHILVVDDEPDIREIARFALERVGGLTVTCAGSSAEALSLASAIPFDAILLDVMMPDVGGIQTAHALRAVPATAHTAIVLLTAKSMTDSMLEGAPVDGILAKPFDPMTLATQVREVLGWKE